MRCDVSSAIYELANNNERFLHTMLEVILYNDISARYSILKTIYSPRWYGMNIHLFMYV